MTRQIGSLGSRIGCWHGSRDAAAMTKRHRQNDRPAAFAGAEVEDQGKRKTHTQKSAK